MLEKITKTSKFLVYALCTNVAFAVVYYLVFTWLVEYSLLYAYVGCLALIVLGLELDKRLQKSLASARIVAELATLKESDLQKNYRLFQWFLDSFVSFRTILFIFYFVVLAVSQITNIDPTLIDGDLNDFVLANSYGIVLLIAFDGIVAQFSRDRKKMEARSESLRKALDEA